LRKRSGFDAIVTGRYGGYFALLQRLLPFDRRPHLLLDVEWLVNEIPAWRRPFSRRIVRWIIQSASRVQVFCHAEAHNYSRYFGVPESKFVWIPYCKDDLRRDFLDAPPTPSGDFIFACGHRQRDYKTLLAAVAGLPTELRIAAHSSALRHLDLPRNVKWLGILPPDEYWRTLRACRFIVFSIRPGLLRYSGVRSYVGAMRAGKCVVINDPFGASSYIDHGKSGFLVEPDDPLAIRRQIIDLLASPELVDAAGANAQQAAAQRFSTKQYVMAIQSAIREATAM
jgi:glycosyltransferase involved in cell wall biosynthesis